jgi:hypothetical protein
VIVRMWEVVAYPDAHQDVVNWVCEVGVPRIEAEMSHISTEVFTSTDHRVVVISRWRGNPADLPEPPRHLTKRSPHSWDFSLVDR